LRKTQKAPSGRQGRGLLTAVILDRLAVVTIHPDKTRLIRFGRFAAVNRKERGLGKPETFNFLGFTMICSTKRNGGF
jgi:hypothetical protein